MKHRIVGSMILFLMLASGMVWGREYAGENPGGWMPVRERLYINARTIAHPAADIVSVWVRVVPEKTSDLFAQFYEELRKNGKDYRTYEYTGFLSEIDCARHRHREVNILHYNRDKNIIHSLARSNAQWVPTMENDFVHIHRAVCPNGDEAWKHPPQRQASM